MSDRAVTPDEDKALRERAEKAEAERDEANASRWNFNRWKERAEAAEARVKELEAALRELVGIVEDAIAQKSTKDMDSFTLQPARAALGESKSHDE